LFATIIELAGGSVAGNVTAYTAIDSVSMTPYLSGSGSGSRRDWVLTEITFGLAPSRAIRNERYKLILQNDRQEFYDLNNDPKEENALDLSSLSPAEMNDYDELRATLIQLIEQ
jgi:arylsulfatase A-like enzyme